MRRGPQRRGGGWLCAALVITLAPPLLNVVPAVAAEPARLAYLERLTGGATSAAGLPVLVAIHALGGSPEDHFRLVERLPARARVILPRGPRRYGRGFAWLPGQYSAQRSVAELDGARRVAALIRAVAPGQRVVVTGYSQGAILSYALAALHPELVRAAVPLSGYLPTPVQPTAASANGRIFLRGLHGRADAVLRLDRARASVERLRKAGFDAALEEYEGVGHEVPPKMLDRLHQLLGALLTRTAPSVHP